MMILPLQARLAGMGHHVALRLAAPDESLSMLLGGVAARRHLLLNQRISLITILFYYKFYKFWSCCACGVDFHLLKYYWAVAALDVDPIHAHLGATLCFCSGTRGL